MDDVVRFVRTDDVARARGRRRERRADDDGRGRRARAARRGKWARCFRIFIPPRCRCTRERR